MNRWLPVVLPIVVIMLSSCGKSSIPKSQLSGPEQNLLAALNDYRVSQGKSVLEPAESLTSLAREDAARRTLNKEGYIDNRRRTGYERMLSLAGKAAEGEDFGSKLMSLWQRQPVQKVWLGGSYAGVGIGTAVSPSGLQTGVLLLGGFSEDGL